MESIRIFHQWFCEWEFAEFPFKKPVMFFGKIFLWHHDDDDDDHY